MFSKYVWLFCHRCPVWCMPSLSFSSWFVRSFDDFPLRLFWDVTPVCLVAKWCLFAYKELFRSRRFDCMILRGSMIFTDLALENTSAQTHTRTHKSYTFVKSRKYTRFPGRNLKQALSSDAPKLSVWNQMWKIVIILLLFYSSVHALYYDKQQIFAEFEVRRYSVKILLSSTCL
jgi:hypothetical protein